ncbi:hypothetical protein MSG28_003490 [Choristoneura fumiferana]|uniref:Uncharacterized protein n=1 Tax=Choristoneura fumiferana TaxID=7141 RepID=A0ACC0KF30_CHOFU|nr:hypothetical protein MSG28_003490 [Choristoneura fumiferana]
MLFKFSVPQVDTEHNVYLMLDRYRGAADRPSVHVQRPARGAACVNSAAPRPPDGQPLRGRFLILREK